MIRRLFWLLLGALLGVTGNRKVTALARSLRPAPRPSALAGQRRHGLPPGRPAPGGAPRRPPHHHDELKDGR